MPLTLTLSEPSSIPLEVDSVTFDAVRGRSVDAIRSIPIQRGNKTPALGEHFEVSGSADDGEIVWRGDCAKVKHIAAGMTDGRVRVVFTVSEYPNMVRDVIYKHAKHVGAEELEGITGLRKGVPLDPVTNKSACFKIQEHMKSKGYYFANVVLEEGDKSTDERVVFNITEGPVVRVRSINFTGQNELATAERLRVEGSRDRDR